MPIAPRDVRKALQILETDLQCNRSIGEIAAACDVGPRTLQRHFRSFLGMTPSRARQDARLEQARRELLRAQRHESVSSIAARCGFGHLGRFAVAYRERYGEPPSATLRRRTAWLSGEAQLPTLVSPRLDRPVVAVHAFDVVDAATCVGAAAADEISIALMRNRWLVVGSPSNARYHLRGKIRRDSRGRSCHILGMLSDSASGRHIWADRWSGDMTDAGEFEERVALRVAAAVDRALQVAEVDRARRQSPAQSGAWELTMRALPRALTLSSAAQEEAIELLEHAMELDPCDPLPVALAAWCHAQRGTHHFTGRSAAAKRLGRELVMRATRLNPCDARVEALLATAETLGHDLAAAARHCERALALDGGCTWGWMRNGFVHAYSGRSADAVECFQIAKALGPDDPMSFCCSIGLGIAHFEAGKFEEAVRWWTRLLVEHPSAMWANRFLAPALLLAGRKDEARRSFVRLAHAYPQLTIHEVRSALPHTESYLNRACEGLNDLGMRP